MNLARDGRQLRVAKREGRRRERVQRGAQLFGQDGMEAHDSTMNPMCPYVKDTFHSIRFSVTDTLGSRISRPPMLEFPA